MNERLKIYLDYKGISQKQFAEMLGSKVQYANGLLTGKDAISMNLLLKFTSLFPDLNIDWLITGRGEMLITKYNIKELVKDAVAEAMEAYEVKKSDKTKERAKETSKKN